MQKKKNKVKKQSRFRLMIQVLAASLFNGYFMGFAKGKIFTGDSKAVCLPVLNCYSCPGAVGACPIGALQAVLGGNKHSFSFYVIGTIMLFGVVLGRLVCGFLCPFGLFQDLLHRIPLTKIKVYKKLDKLLRYLKYVILVWFVILLPIFLTNKFGIAPPYFCKWICPAGILEGAFPLVAKNESIRAGLGFLFNWKLGVLSVIIISSIFIYRPFCKYLCPLGGFYGLFNRFGFYQMKVDKSKCTGCKVCEKICDMNVEITKNINSAECIRCGKCKAICPENAIKGGFHYKEIHYKDEQSLQFQTVNNDNVKDRISCLDCNTKDIWAVSDEDVLKSLLEEEVDEICRFYIEANVVGVSPKNEKKEYFGILCFEKHNRYLLLDKKFANEYKKKIFNVLMEYSIKFEVLNGHCSILINCKEENNSE
jgi:ferredoxin